MHDHVESAADLIRMAMTLLDETGGQTLAAAHLQSALESLSPRPRVHHAGVAPVKAGPRRGPDGSNNADRRPVLACEGSDPTGGMVSYERLIDEHDAIDVLAAEVERMAKADGVDPSGVRQTIDHLAIIVAQHVSEEDRGVYGRLIEIDGINDEAGLNLEQEFDALVCDWEGFLSRWSAEAIAADVASFRADTSLMTRRLRQRVQIESRIIYPLALQQKTILLRRDVRS